MKTIFALLLLSVVVALAGCRSQIAQPASEPTVQQPPVTSVPTPSSAPVAIPTPVPGFGTVVGHVSSASPGRSLAGIVVYLGTLLPLSPGPGYLVSVSPDRSPVADVGPDGLFLFRNVPPDKYVIVLWTPHESRMIPDPVDPQRDLIINVMADKITDLGTLTAVGPS
jgi:hypothetical protein